MKRNFYCNKVISLIVIHVYYFFGTVGVVKEIILEREMADTSEKVEVTPEGDGKDSKEDEKEKKSEEVDKDKEVLLIQDTGFNIKIVAPNLEPFDLPVRS